MRNERGAAAQCVSVTFVGPPFLKVSAPCSPMCIFSPVLLLGKTIFYLLCKEGRVLNYLTQA